MLPYLAEAFARNLGDVSAIRIRLDSLARRIQVGDSEYRDYHDEERYPLDGGDASLSYY